MLFIFVEVTIAGDEIGVIQDARFAGITVELWFWTKWITGALVTMLELVGGYSGVLREGTWSPNERTKSFGSDFMSESAGLWIVTYNKKKRI